MSTDTVAADREALRELLTRWEGSQRAEVLMTAIGRSGILRDAAAVRHEHGGRIAQDLAQHAETMERDSGFVGLHQSDSALAALWWASRHARVLSPPP